MTVTQVILLAVFAASTGVGYVLIKQVPSLLHTPLMSGMNALSGVTVLGALSATALALSSLEHRHAALGSIFGGLAIVLATINVVGGFAVTDRMLKMFSKRGES